MGPVRTCFGFVVTAVALLAQSGVVATVAGSNGDRGFGGDGQPAPVARMALANLQNKCDPNRFEQTSHIFVDAKSNIYFADSENQRIRRIDANGVVTTVAGAGDAPQVNALCQATGAAGDGGAATAAHLFNPADVVVQANGNLLIADQQNNRIRQVTSAGAISTIAGSGLHNFYSPGIPATSSPMDWPSSLALDASGLVYFAELHSNRIGRINGDGRLATVAGTGFPGYNGDRIAANTANLSKPAGIAFDRGGNLLIADTGNHRIRRVDSAGTITTVAGTGRADFCGDGGPAAAACLNTPMDVKADGLGNIYIADTGNNRVRRIDSAGNIATVASGLNAPCALAVDSNNDLYIVDWQNYSIKKVTFGAAPVIGGILNGASFDGPVAPGSIIAIFGANLAADTTSADGAPWPRAVNGITLEINGAAAPLYAVSPGQINAQLPFEIPAGNAGAVVVTPNGRSPAAVVTVAPVAVGIFSDGARALAINQDGSLNGPATPEARGRALVVFVTGLGAVTPPVATGEAPSSETPTFAAASISATVGGMAANVFFAGLTPPFVGLGQVNLIVPEGAPIGDAVPLVIQGCKVASVSVR